MQKTINRTIKYEDAETGRSLAGDVVQPAHFTLNGNIDNVTHQIVRLTKRVILLDQGPNLGTG
ncbi:MAG: mucin-binding protein [Limosilactobacillus pontis]